MNIREAYEESLCRDGHEQDPAQETLVKRLMDLQRRLHEHRPRPPGIFHIFKRSGSDDITGEKGLYIWGGVGRGKTFLMDLFFETLAIEAKKRIHFHRMMRDVHKRLRDLGNVADPLDQVAGDIAGQTRVLCFDEFFVDDIGDAMLLAKLLEGLFRRGVTLVATSNSQPDTLYPDGLQRQRFLPAIQLLKEYTDVINLDGGIDYRLRLLEQAGTYLTPDDEAARHKLQHYFDESASSQVMENHRLEVNGREILTHACAKGIVWFDFANICGGPRSQDDYIDLARWYPTVIVSQVPKLDHAYEEQARRFVALVDEFYDRRVKLVVAAAADVDVLYSGDRLSAEFDRTVSRLIEMQSSNYLAAPHLA